MTKTIKFNLVIDGNAVRTIEDLQNNFVLDDVIKYYHNGLLKKWLQVREYNIYMEKFNEIFEKEPNDNMDLALKLIKLFNIEAETNSIKKDIAVLKYNEDHIKELEEYKKNNYKKYKVINDYHAGYQNLINHMIENKDDFSILKADAIEMERSYLGLVCLDYITLYKILIENAPKAIFALMSRQTIKAIYFTENQPVNMKEKVISLAKSRDNIIKIMGEDAKIIQRNTQGMWDPIERNDKNIIVLYLPENMAFVKNYQGPLEEKMSSQDIMGNFVLLRGLEYQCNSESYKLIYMEV